MPGEVDDLVGEPMRTPHCRQSPDEPGLQTPSLSNGGEGVAYTKMEKKRKEKEKKKGEEVGGKESGAQSRYHRRAKCPVGISRQRYTPTYVNSVKLVSLSPVPQPCYQCAKSHRIYSYRSCDSSSDPSGIALFVVRPIDATAAAYVIVAMTGALSRSFRLILFAS